MKTFETTTQIVNLICCCTYWGPFEYERLWRDSEAQECENGNFVCGDYDRNKLKDAIVKEANAVFEEAKPFKDYGVISITATNMGSPKEYNFGGDWLDLVFVVEDDFLDKAEKAIFNPKYHDLLDAFARSEWSSRDGFISEMPAYSLEEMHDVFDMLRNDTCGRDDMRAFGSVVALLRVIDESEHKHEIEDDVADWGRLTDELVNRFIENHDLSEFCTILSKEDAEKKFHGIFFDEIEKWRGIVKVQHDKYCELVDSEAAKKNADAIVDRVNKELDGFVRHMHDCVEWWYPNRNEINARLVSLRQEFDTRCEAFWREPPKGQTA